MSAEPSPTDQPDEPTVLWRPGEHELEDSAIARFQRGVAERHGIPQQGYAELWAWSVEHLGDFWSELWDFYGLPERPADSPTMVGDTMPGGTTWFPGTTLNYTSYLFDRLLADGGGDKLAIIGTTETGERQEWTRKQLRAKAYSVAVSLKNLGIEPGDRVVAYLPNVPDAVAAFLGTVAIGAVWSSVGQDYAPGAVIDRFAQLEPRVLITADGYHWAGRNVDRTAATAELREGLPTLEHVILIPHLHEGTVENSLAWADLSSVDAQGFEPVQLPFEAPIWVLFSSGTTGLPKGLVHGHGGILLEMLKTLGLHMDMGPGDRFFWYASPSWVMWNIQVSALMLGATIVCHDGSPTAPTPDGLWELAARESVTYLGISPGYLLACEHAGLRPGTDHDLSSLRAMGCTGSPLSPHSHQWTRDEVAPVPLWSISGGTDVGSGFAGGVPTVPVWAGEISAACLGIALDVWDENGTSVRAEVGEMVITKPMPSMPLRLWNDPGDERYRATYFEAYPGVWRHGDWMTMFDRGSCVIHGRSDSTLNRNGIRMGSADIYAAVETVPEVIEALVIGAEQADGSYWMPLFVVLDDGASLDDGLRKRLVTAIGEKASPRHVPDEIRQIRAVPHTRTGKKLEVPVKRILQGHDLSKVANPETIDDPSLLADFAAIRAERYPG